MLTGARPIRGIIAEAPRAVTAAGVNEACGLIRPSIEYTGVPFAVWVCAVLAVRDRLVPFFLSAWRLLRIPFWLGFGFAVGFVVPYSVYLDSQIRLRFDDLAWDLPSRVYARPLLLTPGMPLSAETLVLELEAARYSEDQTAKLPGSYHHDGNHFVIARRAFNYLDGHERARRFDVLLSSNSVTALKDADTDAALTEARLDPARIATLYGNEQTERRLLRLGNVPPLLIAGLQAVEDRDFKHHHGIALAAIVRAAFANLMAGHVVQGGSTLTQQLVKNLFLDRGQRYTRKFNEALLALLIEARYDKHRILEAYLNEVFLGQQGGQAVHGFAAASEFYFGRDLNALTMPEIALLIGMVQGPSLYDPRRNPGQAKARRDRVLEVFNETNLITQAQAEHARATPLMVSETPGLPRNRYPAFLELLRTQLAHDYPEGALRSEGLSVHTTLAPATQALAERALTKELDAIGKRQPDLEGAMVVTGAHDGEVQALIGARDPDQPGFNRALAASRPIGSLIKPFVYLVALAQPQRFSLISPLDDTAVDLRQADGSHWTPQNAEHETHGNVPLIDALTHSYNLATVHLGLALGVAKVRGLIESFGLNATINPNPSLLLGALDLSPYDVAQLYQYFSADGHAVPLRTVRGVLDAQGKPLTRYAVKSGSGEYVAAARLVNFALQQVTTAGTARAVDGQGLGYLNAAGKTGTSDSQRDSWFAGFTDEHLAVVWVGRDDNQSTGLMGATGALKVWIALFHQLPSKPLALSHDELEFVSVDPASGARIAPECPGARTIPFLAGYAPSETDHCPLQQLKALFGNER